MTITLLAPDGVQVTAQQERQARAAGHGGGAGRPLGGRSGFRVDTPSNVLTATSTTWTLGPCSAMLDPGASTHQGMYGWASDANITGSVTPADSTNARKDIVYIQINDSTAGDGSGEVTYSPKYLAGTASSSPVSPWDDPAKKPARSFLVGTIDVPVAGAGSPTVTLNPARYVSAGAPLPVFTQAERDALTVFDGLTVRRLDVAGRPLETWDGAEWQRFSREFGKASGVASIGIVPAGSQVGPFRQNFPAGKFTVAPTVLLGTNQARLTLSADNITASGFDLYMGNWSPAASGNGQIRWTAQQSTATSATG